jgi:hypothetical protein
MSLLDHVHVDRRFQRAIRIDTDLHDSRALEGFICPKSSAEVLLTMARHIREVGQAAFTWTGPYGSGKSSLVLALGAILNGNSKLRDDAASILGKRVARELWEALPPRTKGWRIIPVVGQRCDPAKAIGDAIMARGYVERRSAPRWTATKVVETLTTLASQYCRSYGGMILVVDEMGKFLEGAAQDGGDIYLFQQLAEAASRCNRRLVVVGILHQAFDEYAQRVSRDQRDEWAKVQGRFVDLIVNVAGDEQLELLSRAIRSDRVFNAPSPLATKVAKFVRAGRAGAVENLALTLEKCWPLHSVVTCLLGPISRRRFGQNQRSLFGFLNSAEPFAFQDFLRNAREDELYTPDRLWDYLRTNLEPSILASPDGHRWSIAVEAIERCDVIGGTALHVSLLKTIALLDLFRERSGLSATPELLATCGRSKVSLSEVTAALKQLATWSFVIFRKHLGAYALFAGSDFDIEHALSEAMDSVREINFRELRTIAGLQPILAKRHYHETGALRWFDVDLVPLVNIAEYATGESLQSGAMGRFLVAIPTNNENRIKAKALCESAIAQRKDDVVIGVSPHAWQVIQLAKEFLALTEIHQERPELAGDPVARREVLGRLVDVRGKLEADLQRMLHTAEWYRSGQSPTRYSAAELNGLASAIADERFPATPRLPNELLNRVRPSSNAIAAQKVLLKRMVQSEGQPRLGIEGFPAEGGLCDSILVKAGLYREMPDGGWHFVAPDKNDPCSLMEAWQAATDLLQRQAHRTVSLTELYQTWRLPPYGVKDGLLPILAVVFVLAHRDRLALYREGIFQPRFTDLDVDYLTADSALIQLRWMVLSDLSRQLLSGLAEVVRNLDFQNRLVHLEPIDVARGLVSIFENLRPWTKRTSRLSANAVRVRSLFKQASDPNKFLFDDIPKLFGDALAGSDKDRSHDAISSIVHRVREGLEELTCAYGDMLRRFQELMFAELQVPNDSPQALADLRGRAENIRQLGGDFRLNAFVNRLSQFTGAEDDMEGIASLVLSKPPREWIDADLDQGSVEIADLAQRFLRAEAFAHVKGRADKRQVMAVVVGLNGRPTPVFGEFDITDKDYEAVNGLIANVEAALKGSNPVNKNVTLAALAQLSARYLLEREEDIQRKNTRPKRLRS